MDSIRTNASSSVETLLVGNKVDRPLPRVTPLIHADTACPPPPIAPLLIELCFVQSHQIETSRGKAMAAEFGIPFFETSAKDGTNVKKSFQTIARAVVKRMAGEQAMLAHHRHVGFVGVVLFSGLDCLLLLPLRCVVVVCCRWWRCDACHEAPCGRVTKGRQEENVLHYVALVWTQCIATNCLKMSQLLHYLPAPTHTYNHRSLSPSPLHSSCCCHLLAILPTVNARLVVPKGGWL